MLNHRTLNGPPTPCRWPCANASEIEQSNQTELKRCSHSTEWLDGISATSTISFRTFNSQQPQLLLLESVNHQQKISMRLRVARKIVKIDVRCFWLDVLDGAIGLEWNFFLVLIFWTSLKRLAMRCGTVRYGAVRCETMTDMNNDFWVKFHTIEWWNGDFAR